MTRHTLATSLLIVSILTSVTLADPPDAIYLNATILTLDANNSTKQALATKGEIILATGTTFILDQIPPPLQWLAGPIARATVLRSLRLKNVADLMSLIADPVPEYVREDLERHNGLVQYLRDLERPVQFVERLNTWQVRLNPNAGHWAIGVPVAFMQLLNNAQFTSLKRTHTDEHGHRYFQIVSDREADGFEDGKLSIGHLKNDHFAWIGV